MSSTARGRIYVLAAAVLWSLSGAITKSIDLDGLTIAFYRGLFAGLVLVPIVPRQRWVFRPVMVPLGLVFGAMTGLFLAAMKATTAANVIFLQYSATFWVVPLGVLFLKEHPDRRALGGIALAMVGIGVIVGSGHHGGREWVGVALGLGSGVAYAGVVIGMRGLRGLDPVWLSAVNNLSGALALGAWMTLNRGRPPLVPSLPQALALIAFGVIQMAIPYALFARGLREVSAPEAGLIALVEPILNPVWVLIVTRETPSVPTLIGGLLLLAGVAARYLSFPARAGVHDPSRAGTSGGIRSGQNPLEGLRDVRNLSEARLQIRGETCGLYSGASVLNEIGPAGSSIDFSVVRGQIKANRLAGRGAGLDSDELVQFLERNVGEETAVLLERSVTEGRALEALRRGHVLAHVDGDHWVRVLGSVQEGGRSWVRIYDPARGNYEQLLSSFMTRAGQNNQMIWVRP